MQQQNDGSCQPVALLFQAQCHRSHPSEESSLAYQENGGSDVVSNNVSESVVAVQSSDGGEEEDFGGP